MHIFCPTIVFFVKSTFCSVYFLWDLCGSLIGPALPHLPPFKEAIRITLFVYLYILLYSNLIFLINSISLSVKNLIETVLFQLDLYKYNNWLVKKIWLYTLVFLGS